MLLGLTETNPASQHRERREDTYGSWDWFVKQIENEGNSNAKPTESALPIARNSVISKARVYGTTRAPYRNQRARQVMSTDRFRPMNKVQFIGTSRDRNAIQYNTWEDNGGSGDFDNVQSFLADSNTNDKVTIQDLLVASRRNGVEPMRSQFGQGTPFGSHNEKADNNNFIFDTQVMPAYDVDPVPFVRSTTPVTDGALLPITLVNEWPSNTQTLGGAIFEVANFIFGDAGTCFINLPVAVYWFHAFNAHIDASQSDPTTGVYALVAANQHFEGISTLDFIVNFASDDLRFSASQIELSCQSGTAWTSSVYSFPGDTNGHSARTNIRRPNDGNGFNNKQVIVEFPYGVTGFHVDDERVTVASDGGDATEGTTFTLTGFTSTYIEEIWMGWNYQTGGWFTAADTSVSIFDETS